jgi:RNA polymerase sigma factor (sigma-70 family)
MSTTPPNTSTDLSALTDLAALRAVAHDRDPQAFGLLVQRYQAMVLATCMRVLRSTVDAEDAAQETFLKLARSAHAINGCLPAWLHACASGTAKDYLRRTAAQERAVRRAAELPAPSPVAAEWRDLEPVLDDAMQQLDESTRDLIIAHFLAGVTQAQLARDAGVATGTISRRISTGLEALATLLRSNGFATLSIGSLAGALAFGGASSPTSAAVAAGAAKAALSQAALQSGGGAVPASTAKPVAAQAVATGLSGKAIAAIALAGLSLAGGVGVFVALRTTTAAAPQGVPSLSSMDRPTSAQPRMPMSDLEDGTTLSGPFLEITGSRITYSVPRDWTGPLEHIVLERESTTLDGATTVSRVRVVSQGIARPDSPMPPPGSLATVRLSETQGLLRAEMIVDGAEGRIESFTGRIYKPAAQGPTDAQTPAHAGTWRSIPNWSLSIDESAIAFVVDDFVVEKYRVINWTPTPTGARVETLCTTNILEVPMIGKRAAFVLEQDTTSTNPTTRLVRHTFSSGNADQFPVMPPVPNAPLRTATFVKELP